MGNGSLKTDNTLAIDIDAELILAELPVSYKKCLSDIKPGFLQFQVMHNDCNFSERVAFSFDNTETDFINKSGFLLPNKVKDYLLRTSMNKIKNQMTHSNIERLSRFLQTPVKVVSFVENVTKATYLQQYYLYVEGKFYLQPSFDIATLFRLEWMSKYAERWTKRKRLWPSLETLASELNTTYIITKPSAEEKNNKLTKELRYSFSHIERKIISMQSNEQRVVYFISKTIFYGSLKPLDPEKVQSFLLKNTMLWLCEQYPPHHDMWHYTNILNVTVLLYKRLLGYLEQGFMPYYFIEEVNILSRLQLNTIRKMIGIIQKIIADPLKFLPPEGKSLDVCAALETITKHIWRGERYYSIFKNMRFLDQNFPLQ